ncbi:MAG TPA: hypothetical protein VN886_13105 [Acidimicrobiales bacterium]|nr:hypothetical protein [Acidimicrobiales bacterium]
MQNKEAEQAVRELGTELVLTALEIAHGQRKLVGLRQIIKGYIALYPDLASMLDNVTLEVLNAADEPPAEGEQEGRPRGAEAVHLILQEHPNEELRVSECVGELRKRGWLPDSDNPANAVRAALERLVADSDESDVVKYVTRNYVAYSYEPDRIRSSEGGYGFDEEPF